MHKDYITVEVTRRFLWFSWTTRKQVEVEPAPVDWARYDEYHNSNAWGRS